MIATQELVVPRSIPIILLLLIGHALYKLNKLSEWGSES
jgi:hypothetical protein